MPNDGFFSLLVVALMVSLVAIFLFIKEMYGMAEICVFVIVSLLCCMLVVDILVD